MREATIFTIKSIDDAKKERWDVIVAGSSFASMFFLRGLPSHLRVLVLEKGQLQAHSDQLARGIQVEEDIPIENSSGHEKRWRAHTVFGGNSNCWWAATPRFHPNDFKLQSLYGVGMDWQVSYDDLEPYYAEVEQVMEIAGGGTDHILPRSTPFPFEPHAPSRSDVTLQAFSKEWVPHPTARANGGSRAQCCANGICHLCPVDAKFSILNGISHFVRDEVALCFGAEVRSVDVENGVARGVLVRSADGAEHVIAADMVALGANAIFNAAILLRSGINNPHIGRYLHEQVSVFATVDTGPGERSFYGGTSITGHGYALYDGPHRSEVAGVLLENHNAPAPVRPVFGRWSERVKIKLIAEDLPQADNRVFLRNDDVATDWVGHSEYAMKGLDRAVEKLPDVIPFTIEDMHISAIEVSEAHIQGTHRMGADASNSVVDGFLKCHDVSNVLALGAGVFPTSSPANPTLTLSSLSARAARHV